MVIRIFVICLIIVWFLVSLVSHSLMVISLLEDRYERKDHKNKKLSKKAS